MCRSSWRSAERLTWDLRDNSTSRIKQHIRLNGVIRETDSTSRQSLGSNFGAGFKQDCLFDFIAVNKVQRRENLSTLTLRPWNILSFDDFCACRRCLACYVGVLLQYNLQVMTGHVWHVHCVSVDVLWEACVKNFWRNVVEFGNLLQLRTALNFWQRPDEILSDVAKMLQWKTYTFTNMKCPITFNTSR